MNSVIELDKSVYAKLEQNAERKGVTPEVWLENLVDEEFNLANLPRFSDEERERIYRRSQEQDLLFDRIMNEKYEKIMGRSKK